jgi:hypothetical protein
MRAFKRILFILTLSAGVAYLTDTCVLRYRIMKNLNPYGSATLQRFYAIAEKNNRVEFDPADPETVDCVHALFPHAGDTPCWYVTRKKEERIDE